MPQVSVVIPVYNVGGYLLACLDSVSNQTLSDIEVICVDDGSTDESGRLLDLYGTAMHCYLKQMLARFPGMEPIEHLSLRIIISPSPLG